MKSKIASILIFFAFSSCFRFACGQDTLLVKSALQEKRYADSSLAAGLSEKAREFLSAANSDSALSYLSKSLTLADASGFLNIAAGVYELLATVYEEKSNWNEILRNNLRAAEAYGKLGDRASEARILKTIAGNYFRKEIYKKAALYYEQAFELHDSQNLQGMASSAEMAGLSYFNLPLDTLSSVWYGKAASFYEEAGDAAGLLRCREKLGLLYTQLSNFNKALDEYEKVKTSYQKEDDFLNVASTYSQIGFLMFRRKDVSQALENFSLAIESAEKAGNNDYFLTEVWSNKAICWQNLGNETEMLASFMKALEYAESSGREDEAARIERIMSTLYFRKGDNYHAEIYCLDCIESARTSANLEQLNLCYLDYSNILESGNDFIKALEYYEKYLNLRDSLNYEKRLAEKEASDRIAGFEDIEQKIRDEIASEEIQTLELKNLRAESLRRENEINLLLKQQELDRSEKDRLSTSLALEREKTMLYKREQAIISLKEQQKYDSLALFQKDLEAERLTTQNQLLETQKKQEEERSQKARQIRNMAIGLGALMVIVALMILFGLISTRKKNLKLAESKKQIERINADLEKTNAEVLRQKDIIEQKNQSITDSIQYAGRIQSAVLPPVNFIDEWRLENFILFKPKDIVSGDFYWGTRKNDRIIIAAADCTGHGVPGAFMSMLGHAFLEEIVNTGEVNNAAMILNILRDEIINTLRQKGMVGEARDGMDISLVMLDLRAGSMDYAGANNPVYLIRDGKMTKYLADRMPIGIHFISFTPFTNRKIEIRKGDCLYLFSDGYADQFGGPRGKKFMYKPFQDLLLRTCDKPMELQKEILDRTFGEWKGDREQVDDVMVIGIKI